MLADQRHLGVEVVSLHRAVGLAFQREGHADAGRFDSLFNAAVEALALQTHSLGHLRLGEAEGLTGGDQPGGNGRSRI